MISLRRTTASPLVIALGVLLVALAIGAGPAFVHGVEAG